MLKVNCPDELPAQLQQQLDRRRDADAAWNSLRGSQAERQVKQTLADAFHSKCGYCEKIEADTVDHFWPKERYPARTWDWRNYVLACDQCQRTYKRDQDPVDDGQRQMINPRYDDPMTFLYFDYETGAVVARRDSDECYHRGHLTIERLGLDRRSQLQDERRRRLVDVLDGMRRVITDVDARDEAWQSLRDHLRPDSPYLGMIRQLLLTDDRTDPQYRYRRMVDELRRVRPEFDDVVAEWCEPKEG